MGKGLAVLILAAFGFVFAKNRRAETESRWEQAVAVTDDTVLSNFDSAYHATVLRIQRVHPDSVKQPVWDQDLRVHPGPLPKPYADKWAVSFPQHPDGGNPGGNIVIVRKYLHLAGLRPHEAAHIITRITDHPSWLFGPGLPLNIP
jgi:hypothetical protein